MGGKDLYEDFLKSLKVAITNASIYFEDHPVLLRATEALKSRIDKLLKTSGVISLGFTQNSILVGKEYFDGERLYQDLAYHFHRRKIKKIIIEEGYTLNELRVFLQIISLPLNEIFKKGGPTKLSEDSLLSHIVLEELDYSEFISQIARGSLKEKDLWRCIIEDIYNKGEFSPEAESLLENFNHVLGNFTYDDIEEDPSLVEKLIRIIKYAQEHNKDKVKEWSRHLAAFFLRENRCIYNREVAEHIKDFFREMSIGVLSEAIWESNFANKKFDPLTLKLFSRLLDGEKNEEISIYLANKLEEEPYLFHDREAQENLKNLFNSIGDDFVSKPYRETLSKFVESIRKFGDMNIEYAGIYEHYHHVVLLNILDSAESEAVVQMVVKCIRKEFKYIFGRSDYNFLKSIVEVVDSKLADEKLTSLHSLYRECRSEIINHLRENVLEMVDNISEEHFDSFLQMVGDKFVDASALISHIVSSSPPSPSAIRLFFRVFPKNKDELIDKMKHRLDNFEFCRGVIEALKGIDNEYVHSFLKDMFGIVNPLLKVEVLKAMRYFSSRDYDFLFGVLATGDIFLKRAVMKILKYDKPEIKKRGLMSLFKSVRWFFVSRRVVYDNLRIIEEENIKEAVDILYRIKGKIFLPWDRKVKKEIEKTILYLKGHA